MCKECEAIKKDFGALWEAIRKLSDQFGVVKPWEDLSPAVQTVFSLSLSQHPDTSVAFAGMQATLVVLSEDDAAQMAPSVLYSLTGIDIFGDNHG